MAKEMDVRIAEKPVLTIEEAAALFSIGESKIRQLISIDPSANWILRNGTWYRIKRKAFEAMIDSVDAI